MTKQNTSMSLQDVLDEAFFSADKPTAAMFLRVCEAHPEYRDDILEFAALWSSYEASPEPTNLADAVPEESVSRLQSYVLNRMHGPGTRISAEDLGAVSAAIDRLAGGKNMRKAAQAAELGEATILLQKILTNRISVVPRIVLNRLSQHMNLAFDVLVQSLSLELAGERRYKASFKPNAPATETWESAVRALTVSEAEKARLLMLQD